MDPARAVRAATQGAGGVGMSKTETESAELIREEARAMIDRALA
jgi:hypothetical protein